MELERPHSNPQSASHQLAPSISLLTGVLGEEPWSLPRMTKV